MPFMTDGRRLESEEAKARVDFSNDFFERIIHLIGL